MESKNDNANYLVFAALGFEIVALEVSLIYAGRWADGNWGWGSNGAAAGAVLGLVIWFVHIFFALSRLDKQSQQQGNGNQTIKSDEDLKK